MKLSLLVLSLLFFITTDLHGQNDTSMTRALDPVFVTAHRDGRKLSTLSTAALFIPQEQIKIMGSVRVQQILAEQNGIQIVPQVNGLGFGIQLQGFNPDYTLILLDGEPLIGRNTGLLDINRLSINPIKQIEIVKGPSSSLYGSEALAGVVNIITQRSNENQLKASIKQSSHQTSDISVSGGYTHQNGDALIQVSRFATNGYDLSPASYGQTVSPHQQWSFFGKTNKSIGKHDLSLSARYFNEEQQSQYLVNQTATKGTGNIQDWMINPVWKFKMTPYIHSTLRAYYTQYNATAVYLKDHSEEVISNDDFHQSFARIEWNPKIRINEYQTILAGAGLVNEKINTIRYGSNEPRHQYTQYAFGQYTITPSDHKELNLGLRYDHNNVYGGQLSPKISFITPVTASLLWNGSAGMGFKSPDFRQLYLDFTNAAGGGYIVLGREVLNEKLSSLQNQNLIATLLKDVSNENAIKPERSYSFNTAIKSVQGQFNWELGLFYHRVSELIETEPVAQLTSGSNIYSYFNISKVRIQGLDAQCQWRLNQALRLQAGYQLLYAHDLQQLDLLKQGLKFRRDPVTLSSVRINQADYFGLSNRSRHSAQIKLFYQSQDQPWNASVRMQYRSRFGLGSNSGVVQGGEVFVSERSGNDILDKYDAFVKGYALMNISAGWTAWKPLELQIGIDNVWNKTIPEALPSLPGRIIYFNVNYSISKKAKHS
ncbi:MAG: TonB-dependent receptor [Saprospiraceae bacterium]